MPTPTVEISNLCQLCDGPGIEGLAVCSEGVRFYAVCSGCMEHLDNCEPGVWSWWEGEGEEAQGD